MKCGNLSAQLGGSFWKPCRTASILVRTPLTSGAARRWSNFSSVTVRLTAKKKVSLAAKLTDGELSTSQQRRNKFARQSEFLALKKWQCSNNSAGYLPVFHNGCDLKWVSLLGVKSPAFPVDSLQSRGKQRHQPMGWGTAARPYLIHTKALRQILLFFENYQCSSILVTFPAQWKTDNSKAKRLHQSYNSQRNRGWTPIAELLPAGTQPVAQLDQYPAFPLVEKEWWRNWLTGNFDQWKVVCAVCEFFFFITIGWFSVHHVARGLWFQSRDLRVLHGPERV